jgi:hypothetical protein
MSQSPTVLANFNVPLPHRVAGHKGDVSRVLRPPRDSIIPVDAVVAVQR